MLVCSLSTSLRKVGGRSSLSRSDISLLSMTRLFMLSTSSSVGASSTLPSPVEGRRQQAPNKKPSIQVPSTVPFCL